MSNPLGIPKSVRFAGKDYPVQDPRTFEVEGMFTAWLEWEAYLAVERHRGKMPRQEVDRQHDAWRRDCGAHLYDWGSELWLDGYRSDAGVRELAYLQMKAAEDPQKPVDRELIDAMFKDAAAAKELTSIVWELHRPNPEGPAARSPGSHSSPSSPCSSSGGIAAGTSESSTAGTSPA